MYSKYVGLLKCTFSLSTFKFILPFSTFTLVFEGSAINDVKYHKHLGVLFSHNLTWNVYIDEICTKAMRRLNVFRSHSFKLSRRALETMYFSFIRPILEYGDVLLTNCGSVNAKKLEKVQLQAARIVTGALQPTPLAQLYKETGWQTLAERHDIHCLCLFYKIVNGLTPSYLSELVPVQPVHSYNLRNMTGIQNLFCHTSRFHESFIPYVTTLCNNLSGEVRHSETLIIFKKHSEEKHSQVESALLYWTKKRCYSVG